YIPRPQNPFMLFRANFIKQKHIPGSVETNQSLSKIIGNHWRSLTPEEKNVWEIKAEHEKAAHKIRFPEYRFRPIHNK
ncbi:high mobility group box domain-containing protein, partial [Gymnopilus junonius]